MKFSKMTMTLAAAGVSAEMHMLGADGHGLPPLKMLGGGSHDLNMFTSGSKPVV